MPQFWGKANLVDAHLFAQEGNHLVRVLGTRLPFDAGVNVLGVLAEDHHVGLVGRNHGARHALKPAHRTLADIEIKFLPERHVERTNAAANRRGHGALDAHQELLHGDEGFLRQPFVLAVELEGLLARVNLHPRNAALAAVCLLHRSVNHLAHHRRDVDADAVALDKRDDGTRRNRKRAIVIRPDPLAVRRHLDMLIRHALPPEKNAAFYQPLRLRRLAASKPKRLIVRLGLGQEALPPGNGSCGEAACAVETALVRKASDRRGFVRRLWRTGVGSAAPPLREKRGRFSRLPREGGVTGKCARHDRC